MKIPAGADILCQVHYAPSSIDEWDQSSINLFTKPASEHWDYQEIFLVPHVMESNISKLRIDQTRLDE